MAAIKQKHTYSEMHEFEVKEWRLAATEDVCSSLFYGPRTQMFVTDEAIESLRDLLNEYLLWKKYQLPRIVTEGDILNVQPVAKIENPSDEDASGVPF